MHLGPGPSWQVRTDAPEDLHLALYLRDACRLPVPASVGPLTEPPDPVRPLPAPEREAAAAAWTVWWEAMLAGHAGTAANSPETMTADQRLLWLYQAHAGGGAPDFAAFAGAPAFRAAAVEAWNGGFHSWWCRPAEPAAPAPGSGEPRSGEPRSGPPGGGVKRDLVDATLHVARNHDTQEVVKDLQRTLGRTVRPFVFAIDVLAVRDGMPRLLTPNYAVVPVGFYQHPTRYRDWLWDALVRLA